MDNDQQKPRERVDQIRVRLSVKEKNELKRYALDHELKMSQVARQSILNKIRHDKKEDSR